MLLVPGYIPHSAVQIALHDAMPSSVAKAPASARWLLSYNGKSASDVTVNPLFRQLLQASLPHYPVHWYSSYGKDHALPLGIPYALAGFPDRVTVESDRFVVVSGAFGTEADFKGLLWVNTGSEPPLSIFAFMMQNGSSASFDIYTNGFSPSTPLPPQFVSSLLAWRKRIGIKTISLITVHDAQNHTVQPLPALLGGSY